MGINASANNRLNCPIVFSVWGDNIKLWSSRGLVLTNETQSVVLDIEGVNKLALRATYENGEAKGPGHAVWIEPSLDVDKASSTGLLPLPTVEQMRRKNERDQSLAKARELLAADKFTELDEHFIQALKQKRVLVGKSEISELFRYSLSYDTANEASLKEVNARLARWRAAIPQSPIPLVFMAQIAVDEGFAARGSKAARDVPAEGFRKLMESLKKASNYLDIVDTMEPKFSRTDGIRLQIARNGAETAQQKQRYFLHGIGLDRHDLPLYLAMCVAAQPRWGGAPNQIQKIAEALRKKYPDGWGDKIYAYIAMHHWDDRFYDEPENPAGWDYRKVRPGLLGWAIDSPENEYNAQLSALVACQNADQELARALFDRFGDDDFTEFAWASQKSLRAWRRRMDPDWLTGGSVKTFHRSDRPLNSLDFTNDGKQLVVTRFDYQVEVFDIAQEKSLLHKFTTDMPWMIRTVPHKKIAVFSQGWHISRGGLITFDLDEGKMDQIGETKALKIFVPRQLAPSPDGRWVAATNEENTVSIWPLVDGEIEKTLQLGDSVQGVAFSPDGKTVATGGDRGALRLWDADTGKPRGKPLLEAGKGPTSCHLSFTPDGARLLSVSYLGPAHLWDLAQRKLVAQLPNPGPFRIAHAVSPDGRLFAVSCECYPSIQLYRLDSFKLLTKLEGHYGEVQDLRFSPDSRQLASASIDGDIRLWDVTSYAPVEPKKNDSTRATTQ